MLAFFDLLPFAVDDLFVFQVFNVRGAGLGAVGDAEAFEEAEGEAAVAFADGVADDGDGGVGEGQQAGAGGGDGVVLPGVGA